MVLWRFISFSSCYYYYRTMSGQHTFMGFRGVNSICLSIPTYDVAVTKWFATRLCPKGRGPIWWVLEIQTLKSSWLLDCYLQLIPIQTSLVLFCHWTQKLWIIIVSCSIITFHHSRFCSTHCLCGIKGWKSDFSRPQRGLDLDHF